MNYKSYDDEALRRILIADPDDTIAICEAAERFAKQNIIGEGDIEIQVCCPECDHEWTEIVEAGDT